MEFKPGVVEVNGIKIGLISRRRYWSADAPRLLDLLKIEASGNTAEIERYTIYTYRFIPWVSGRSSSRKEWPTPESCVPAWVKRYIKKHQQEEV